MTKYLFLYRGPATPPEQMTPEATAEIMAAWNRWVEKTGPALVDVGAPTGARIAVADDGTNPPTTDQNGYSVVEAADLDAARELTRDHPFLTEGKGRFAVEIFELIPM